MPGGGGAGAASGLGPATPEPPAPRPRRGRAGAVPGPVRGMAGLPGAARARSASPGSPPALDGSFLLSPLGGLMGVQAVSTGQGARRRGEGIAHLGAFLQLETAQALFGCRSDSISAV